MYFRSVSVCFVLDSIGSVRFGVRYDLVFTSPKQEKYTERKTGKTKERKNTPEKQIIIDGVTGREGERGGDREE